MEKNTTLVPIRVGMILSAGNISMTVAACPHTRGDDPEAFLTLPKGRGLSPYAWG